MKRDMDLIRAILLEVESWGPDDGGNHVRIDGREKTEIDYHCTLMMEAGLIVGHTSETLGRGIPSTWVLRLTNEGHEFLDAARSETVWNKAKGKVASTIGSASLELFKSLLQQIALGQLGA